MEYKLLKIYIYTVTFSPYIALITLRDGKHKIQRKRKPDWKKNNFGLKNIKIKIYKATTLNFQTVGRI